MQLKAIENLKNIISLIILSPECTLPLSFVTSWYITPTAIFRSSEMLKVNQWQRGRVNQPGGGLPAARHSSRMGLLTTTVSFSIFPASSRLGGSARPKHTISSHKYDT